MADLPAVTPLSNADSPPPHSAAVSAASSLASRPSPVAGSASLFDSSPTSSRFTERNSSYATQDVDCVWVNPVCGVQTLENRFGPDARSDIYTSLHLAFGHGEDDIDHGYDASDNEDGDESDNAVYGFENENIQGLHSEGILSVGGSSSSGSGSGHDSGSTDLETAVNIESGHAVHTVSNGPAGAGGTGGTTGHYPAGQPNNPPPLHGPPIPRVARARVNLTALSQRYNLYFAVYQDKIHVYRPQPAPEILRGPLLVLRPPPSPAARLLRGYIDFTFHHQANHILIGNLGDHEIAVLAYDDGDVIAYYTHHIASYIERRSQLRRSPKRSRPPKVPRPFLCETVGKSAWGLAVHSQSRLIAVSSNLAEVNVLAFALRPPRPTDPRQHKTKPLIVPSDDTSPTTWAGVSALELESQLRLRDRNWRILLPLGPNGHNMPSIDFIDDADGNAEKVVAVDINGWAWILDIWKVGSCPLKVEPPSTDLGWGILVLPSKAFLPTKRMPAARFEFDLDSDQYLNLSKIMDLTAKNDPLAALAENTVSSEDSEDSDSHPVSLLDYVMQEDEDSSFSDDMNEDEPGSDSSEYYHKACYGGIGGGFGTNADVCAADPEDAKTPMQNPGTIKRHWDVLIRRQHSSNGSDAIDFKHDAQFDFHLGMVICPSLGLTWSNLSLMALIRTLGNSRYRLDHSREISFSDSKTRSSSDLHGMSRRFSILRTFANSFELFSTARNEPRVVIKDVLKPPSFLPFTLWDMERDFHRCSLLQYIPEISLIVVGNMFGRVVLLRPLRNSRESLASSGTGTPRRRFRAEWVLPLARDEKEYTRPPCCLLGIAVSPVPEPGAGEFKLFSAKKHNSMKIRRRWRLILHYMDHTMLQYYIEEKKPGSEELALNFG